VQANTVKEGHKREARSHSEILEMSTRDIRTKEGYDNRCAVMKAERSGRDMNTRQSMRN